MQEVKQDKTPLNWTDAETLQNLERYAVTECNDPTEHFYEGTKEGTEYLFSLNEMIVEARKIVNGNSDYNQAGQDALNYWREIRHVRDNLNTAVENS